MGNFNSALLKILKEKNVGKSFFKIEQIFV